MYFIDYMILCTQHCIYLPFINIMLCYSLLGSYTSIIQLLLQDVIKLLLRLLHRVLGTIFIPTEKCYSKFCTTYGLNTLPLDSDNVIPFLQLYSDSVGCYSTVPNVFSSLKTMSKIKGLMPSDHFIFNVNLYLLGLKRCMSNLISQLLPVTLQLLLKLHSCINISNCFHVCIWATILFLFFTLFHKSNVQPQ